MPHELGVLGKYQRTCGFLATRQLYDLPLKLLDPGHFISLIAVEWAQSARETAVQGPSMPLHATTISDNPIHIIGSTYIGINSLTIYTTIHLVCFVVYFQLYCIVQVSFVGRHVQLYGLTGLLRLAPWLLGKSSSC